MRVRLSRVGSFVLALVVVAAWAAEPAMAHTPGQWAAAQPPTGVEAPGSATDLLPTGELRVGLFTTGVFPNLVAEDPATGEIFGLGGDLARELAAQMGVNPAWSRYPGAGGVIAAANDDAWDVYFIGSEAIRAQGWQASPPYVLVDQTYLVQSESSFSSVSDVDQPGIRISSWRGSGSDLFLGRELQHAQLISAPSSDAAMELLQSGQADAYASNRQDLVGLADAQAGLRILEDFFNVSGVAIALPKPNPALLASVTDFVEWAKASGLVEQSIRRHGMERQVRVAPPAGS